VELDARAGGPGGNVSEPVKPVGVDKASSVPQTITVGHDDCTIAEAQHRSSHDSRYSDPNHDAGRYNTRSSIDVAQTTKARELLGSG
jgi:hypothetical protein